LEGLGKISKLAIDLFEELAKALAVERIIAMAIVLIIESCLIVVFISFN
jgi:hypothetical protein